jgi:uncharacterized DUF497 family protein
MRFDGDAANRDHLARHRDVNVAEVEAVLQGRFLVLAVAVIAGEKRNEAVGETESGRVLVVIFTVRGDAARPITACRAEGRRLRTYLPMKEATP